MSYCAEEAGVWGTCRALLIKNLLLKIDGLYSHDIRGSFNPPLAFSTFPFDYLNPHKHTAELLRRILSTITFGHRVRLLFSFIVILFFLFAPLWTIPLCETEGNVRLFLAWDIRCCGFRSRLAEGAVCFPWQSVSTYFYCKADCSRWVGVCVQLAS